MQAQQARGPGKTRKQLENALFRGGGGCASQLPDTKSVNFYTRGVHIGGVTLIYGKRMKGLVHRLEYLGPQDGVFIL